MSLIRQFGRKCVMDIWWALSCILRGLMGICQVSVSLYGESIPIEHEGLQVGP
jgi:hypothetical protein